MAKVYAAIKGAQGVAPGVIIPFSREVQNSSQQMDRVPAGYLRCDGSTYQAQDYPDLARVLGVGSAGGSGIPACRYPTGLAGTALLNPTLDADGNFTAGTFSVPNLGSKHLQPSNTAGSQYLGDPAMSGGGVVERAGIGYKAQIQNTAASSYTGMIRVEEYKAPATGSPILTIDQSGNSSATISIAQIEAHDHGLVGANAPTMTHITGIGFDTDLTEFDKYGVNLWQGPAIGVGGVNFPGFFEIDHTGADVNHTHNCGGGAASNQLEFTQPAIDLSFSGSTASCGLTADSREHLNHVTSPYMIMEFIVKY